MGYVIKVQKISRTRSTSYYANIPTAVVETMEIEKAEEMELDPRRQRYSHPASHETT